jgi:radical SAM protein with 4Fe4S-binding SPASM domain
MTFAVGVGLTNACNLACAHCYRDTENTYDLSLDQVIALCESIPVRSFNLGTGENALHPQFREIIAYLRGRGVNTTITSNGYSVSALSDDELGFFHDVEFSVDFPTEREQDAFRGGGNWRLVMDQMDRCRRLGVNVTVTAVMMSVNYDKLADVARIATAKGATLRVNVYQPVKSDAFTLSYEQFWDGFRMLFAESAVVACNEPLVRAFLGLGGGRSGCGVETVRLSPRGDVLPCVYWPDKTLRLLDLERFGQNIIHSVPFQETRAIPEFCRPCEFVETCGGGCSGRRKLSGRLDQPDMYCPFLRGETVNLSYTKAESKDLPKSSSACTTIVCASAAAH